MMLDNAAPRDSLGSWTVSQPHTEALAAWKLNNWTLTADKSVKFNNLTQTDRGEGGAGPSRTQQINGNEF